MARLNIPASLLTLAAIAVASSLAPSSARAETAAGETGMSPYQFSGMINSDNVYVRSGFSVNDYPVLKLNKGDAVVVVGQKTEWLKVLPPEGAFCLVGKLWVDARGDGTVGRVHDDATNVNVRIGSTLNNMLAQVVTQLRAGDEVKILGSQDEYYKIAPPPGAFVFVNKRFVDMVKQVAVVVNDGKTEVKPAGTATDVKPPADHPIFPLPDGKLGGTQQNGDRPLEEKNSGEKLPPTGDPVAIDPTTQPGGVAALPTTQPGGEAQAAFDMLETRFADASTKPIGEQPISELLTGYKMLAADKQLPDAFQKTADARIKSLGVRQELFAEYQKTQAEQAAMATKLMPAEAEAKEIEQRIKDSEVKRFAAVGALHTSALPFNGQTLYRLTDPSTGRTVVYVVTADPAVKALEGQFIGIRGDVADDAARKIRYIQPTAAEAVDMAEVTHGTVTSGLMPPSLIATAATAQ